MSVASERACWLAFKAAFDADTGSGGLRESSVTETNASLAPEAFLRNLDDTADSDRNPPMPNIRFEFLTQEFQSPTVDRSYGVVRLHCFARRTGIMDQKIDAVQARLRDLFHKSDALSSTGWSFATVVLQRTLQGPTRKGEIHSISEFIVRMVRTS